MYQKDIIFQQIFFSLKNNNFFHQLEDKYSSLEWAVFLSSFVYVLAVFSLLEKGGYPKNKNKVSMFCTICIWHKHSFQICVCPDVEK